MTEETMMGGVIPYNELTEEELDKMHRKQLVELCLWILRANRRLKNKNENLKKRIEDYIAEIQRINKKAEQRKKESTYQRRTVTLYRRVIEKMLWVDGDF